MKKKILFCAALAVCLGAGAFTAHAWSKADTQKSDLISANVEALADGEKDGEFTKVEKITEQVGGITRVYCECSGSGGSLSCC